MGFRVRLSRMSCASLLSVSRCGVGRCFTTISIDLAVSSLAKRNVRSRSFYARQVNIRITSSVNQRERGLEGSSHVETRASLDDLDHPYEVNIWHAAAP